MRGRLFVYLGYAPGVGKTYRMLQVGSLRKDEGVDVAVGFVETHGRVNTQEQIGSHEVIPRAEISYRGKSFSEMDLDAVIRRHPDLALIDELAHTNVPGCRNEKRWQDVEEILSAGINVLTTLNIQHLDSLNDVIERITGVRQKETIPDAVVRGADDLELVDISPWALRRRMVHGNIYKPDKIEHALTSYFRQGNLTALRELALMWMADRVDEAVQEFEARAGAYPVLGQQERVVVALSGRPEDAKLIRRASRIALRRSGTLLAVHIMGSEFRRPAGPRQLESLRELALELGGRFHEIVGDDVASSLVEFANAERATQLVLGASRRSRWADLRGGSVTNSVLRRAHGMDVHVISQEDTPHGRSLKDRETPALPVNRIRAGFALALGGPPLLALLLAQLREWVELPGVLLLFMGTVIGVAAFGGWAPAIASALSSFLLVNWYFTPPYYRWTIGDPQNVIALLLFVIVASATGGVVARVARERSVASRARAEVDHLVGLAQLMLELDDPLPVVLEHIRRTFDLGSVAVLARSVDGWTADASAGDGVPTTREDAADSFELDDEHVLVLTGHRLSATNRRIVSAFADHVALAVRNRELDMVASASPRGEKLSEARVSMLMAVSHDLKTPLSAIKASIGSLRQEDVEWDPRDRREFIEMIVEASTRLEVLIGNLMDMSRLQVGALVPAMRPIILEDVVEEAIRSTGTSPHRVEVDLTGEITAWADPSLLASAVANVLRNALQWQPEGQPVRIIAAPTDEFVVLRVVDTGPGVDRSEWGRIFDAFQRLGDSSTSQRGVGVGLGLAVARGLVEAMGGSMVPSETPGGGFTMLIRIKASPDKTELPEGAV